MGGSDDRILPRVRPQNVGQMKDGDGDMEQLLSEFRNPSPEYRPAPLWVWNDAMTKEQIDFQLTELAAHGFGGAFVHPRPGMVTEYLSDE